MLARLAERCGGPVRLALVAAIVLAGLALRLHYAVEAPKHQVDDSRAYARIARSLHAGEGFTQGAGPRHRRLQRAENYTPGLPLLVAGAYELRGEEDRRVARVLLAFLSALAVPLAFVLALRIAGPAAGLLAAPPVAAHPALLEYSGMLMTEPVATTALAAVLLSFLAACERPSAGRWALAGALQGALAMLRPEYLLLVPVLALVALLRLRPEARLSARLAPAAVMVAGALLVVAPWTLRNLIVLDRVVPLSTGGGQILFQGSYIDAGPDPEAITPHLLAEEPWIRRRLAPLPGPIYRGDAVAALAARRHPGEDRDRALRRMALEAYADAARERPLRLAGFLAEKAWFAWTGAPRAVMEPLGWRLLTFALLTAALLGLAAGLRRGVFDVQVVAAVLATTTLVQMAFIASPRRTLVLLPLVAALAGVGCAWTWRWLRSRGAAA